MKELSVVHIITDNETKSQGAFIWQKMVCANQKTETARLISTCDCCKIFRKKLVLPAKDTKNLLKTDCHLSKNVLFASMKAL